MTKDLNGIVVNDFTRESQGKVEGEVRLAAGSRPDNCDDWMHLLPEFLQFDAFVVFLQDLIVCRAFERHAVCADLTHADSVSPTASVKHDAEHVALPIPLDIERKQAIPQTEQRTDPQRAHRSLPGRPDNLRAQSPIRRTACNDTQIPDTADIQRLECRIQLLPRLVNLPQRKP